MHMVDISLTSVIDFFIWESHIENILARMEQIEFENNMLQSNVIDLTSMVGKVYFENHNVK